MVPKSKSCQIYLEISTPVNLEILYLKSQDFLSKIYFRQIVPKFKTSPDLLENVYSSNLEGVESRSNIDIL